MASRLFLPDAVMAQNQHDTLAVAHQDIFENLLWKQSSKSKYAEEKGTWNDGKNDIVLHKHWIRAIFLASERAALAITNLRNTE